MFSRCSQIGVVVIAIMTALSGCASGQTFPRAVTGIAYDSLGENLYGCCGATIHKYDPLTGVKKDVFANEASTIECLKVSCKNKMLVGTSDKLTVLRQLPTSTPTGAFAQRGTVVAVAFSDADWWCSADRAGHVEFHDAETLRASRDSQGGFVCAAGAKWKPTLFATCVDNDQVITLWEATSGEQVGRIRTSINHIKDVAFHPTQHLIVAVGPADGQNPTKGEVQMHNVDTGQQVWRDEEERPARAVAFSSDGCIGVGLEAPRPQDAAKVILRSGSDGTVLQKLEGPKASILALTFRPGDRKLACAGSREEVKVLPYNGCPPSPERKN